MFSFGKKFFDLVTPYHRIFLTLSGEDNVITLPAKQTALYFLSNGDAILLDNLDDLDSLVWLDYDLLHPKTGDPKFIKEFNDFKDLVKKFIVEDKKFIINIKNKVVYSKNCQILGIVSDLNKVQDEH